MLIISTEPNPSFVIEFLEQIQNLRLKYSVKGEDRLRRSHGQTLHEIFTLRTNKLPVKIPDIVIWPGE